MQLTNLNSFLSTINMLSVVIVVFAAAAAFNFDVAQAAVTKEYIDLLELPDNDEFQWGLHENQNSLHIATITKPATTILEDVHNAGAGAADAGTNYNTTAFMHRLTKRQTSDATLPENKSYGECRLSNGEKGNCRHLIYCRLPELQNDIWRFVSQLCIIEQSSIGMCCPDQFRLRSGPQIVTSIDDGNLEQARIVNRPEQRGCGLTTKQFPRITGGRPAEPDEWPWMAAFIRSNEPYVWCGGVLVTDRHILTAAHCLYKQETSNIFVRLGEYNTHLLNETRARDFRIANMVLHIDYDPLTYENDIALVRVDRPTIFNTYIWPVCMPPLGENWEDRMAVVTGWGTTKFGGMHSEILMEAAIPVWKQEDCRKAMVERVPDTAICAAAPEGGQDSCQGDSGGPLLYQLPNQRWITIGVVSWGVRCGEPQRPGLYTRVDKYLHWVIDNSDI